MRREFPPHCGICYLYFSQEISKMNSKRTILGRSGPSSFLNAYPCCIKINTMRRRVTPPRHIENGVVSSARTSIPERAWNARSCRNEGRGGQCYRNALPCSCSCRNEGRGHGFCRNAPSSSCSCRNKCGDIWCCKDEPPGSCPCKKLGRIEKF